MTTILIVNSENKLFEYNIIADVNEYRKPEDVALDKYVEEQLGFNAKFNMGELLYKHVSDQIKAISVKIALINHLCTEESCKINKLFNGSASFVPCH